MLDLSNDTKKRTTKSRETIPLKARDIPGFYEKHILLTKSSTLGQLKITPFFKQAKSAGYLVLFGQKMTKTMDSSNGFLFAMC
jgi:hypothetical protein